MNLHKCCPRLHRSLSIKILEHNEVENNNKKHRVHGGEKSNKGLEETLHGGG